MMTSSIGNIFHVTGPLCGESTGDRWIPLTKASDAKLSCFICSAPEQTVEQSKQPRRRWFKTPLRSLWRHCNENIFPWFHVWNTTAWRGNSLSACHLDERHFFFHYRDTTWALRRLKSPATRLFVLSFNQASNNNNHKKYQLWNVIKWWEVQISVSLRRL